MRWRRWRPICRDGSADVPVYDISRDGRVGSRRFELGDHRAFVGTGIFAAELVGPARERGLLADAVVVRRSRVKNFLRRLAPRPARAPQAAPDAGTPGAARCCAPSPAVLARQIELGCRPCDRAGTLAALRSADA